MVEYGKQFLIFVYSDSDVMVTFSEYDGLDAVLDVRCVQTADGTV